MSGEKLPRVHSRLLNATQGIGSAASFLAPALGFASNLSHTIIREQREDEHSIRSDDSSTDISITDEELALLGPPWAKEGMLCRKQYWECTGKRAKSKAWMDVFVVIQKGELSMFTFGEHGMGGAGVVGGGNWLVSALHPFDLGIHNPYSIRKMLHLSARSCSPTRLHMPSRLRATTGNAPTAWFSRLPTEACTSSRQAQRSLSTSGCPRATTGLLARARSL